ncbi:hypothetical protein YSY43_20890 [Paenibacillus sp. YSY-4.3]
MRKVWRLFKESIWDLLKDWTKAIISAGVIGLLAILASNVKNASSIEVRVKLSVIIFSSAGLLVILILVVTLFKRQVVLKKLYNELLNPTNENVTKFERGDIVIIKTESQSMKPKRLIVFKVTNSHVYCRYASDTDKVIEFAPEELLTKIETETILQNLLLRKHKQENARREHNRSQADFFSQLNR